MSILKHRLVREILGVVFFALALFFLLSLISYHPDDPSFNHVVETRVVHNLIGRFGAYSASFTLTFFGGMAFFLPLALVLMGWSQLKVQEWKYSVSQLLGIFLFIISACGLLSLSAYKRKIFSDFYYGGSIGKGVIDYSRLVSYFNVLGTWIILLTALLVSLMLLTQSSLYDFIFSLKEKIRHMVSFLKSCRINQKSNGAFWKKKERLKGADISSKLSLKRKRKGKGTQLAEGEKFEQILAVADGPPPLCLLEEAERVGSAENKQWIRESSGKLEKKLLEYGVKGNVVNELPGPVVTRYEFEPGEGIKISKIANLSDDLALAMKALSVRIVAPVPGKSVVGLEIPNQHREKVYLRQILESEQFSASSSKLTLALGKDIAGTPYITDLAKMPHLLLAGTTGSGKSVSVNTIICSILFNSLAEEVKFIMIDPKMLELGIYNDIPHLLAPVVVDPKEAANALRWATQEMGNRYRALAEKGVRNIDQYNQLIHSEGGQRAVSEALPKQTVHSHLPYIVVVIDEFADLMIMSGREVETLLIRLAQMARAVGIHLIIATQRPSVDVVTGLIKANFSCRISFRVSSKIDSRTILDTNGAERLLGQGDMLFLPPNSSELIRLHGSFITEAEINRLVKYLLNQGKAQYNEAILTFTADEVKSENGSSDEEYDDLYDKAVDLVLRTRQASISMVQRRLRIGYNRAARMVEIMEREGVVSKPQGSKPREVLVGSDYER